MNTSEYARAIPDPIKRNLRQEAGFGCCACGQPFFEYHHIVPFAQIARHDPADMMVLCPNHHHQATVGAVTIDAQRDWKKRPFNIARGYAEGQLFLNTDTLAVEAGSNQFIGSGFKLVVDNQPLLQLALRDPGGLLLSLDGYSEDDQLLLTIAENEWVSGDPLPWDVEFGYRWLKLRSAPRRIALDIDARTTPLHIGGEFWRKGQHFSLRPDGLEFNGVAKGIGLVDLGLVALNLTADTRGQTFSIAPDPFLGQGALVSWPDAAQRLEKGLEAYRNLLATRATGRNDQCPCSSGKKWKKCHGRGA